MQEVQITMHFPSMAVGLVVGAVIEFVAIVLWGVKMSAEKKITDKSA